MSQVIRKYSDGKPIKLDDDKLFQREGFGAYKREDIANNLAKGLELFIADEKMNEKDAQVFRLIVGQAIEGTRNGQFTRMDTRGIHNTMNWNSSGVTEGKKFLGINVGGLRAFDKSAKTDDGKNNALNALNRFYTKTLNSMSTYDYDKELKDYESKNPKLKYNANTFLTDEISRRWYGGNGIDWDNFSKNRTEQERQQLMSDIYNNANFNELFNKYDWSGSNVKNVLDLTNLFRTFGANIANGTLDNSDYNSFAALGGTDLNLFLTGKKSIETSSSKSTLGLVGKIDTSWNNPDYDRTIDEDGKYHLYIKGTNKEVKGILPGNVFKGVGNLYAFDGNIYDDTNLPEQYKLDIERARQAQLGDYSQLDTNNPFTKMLKDLGYNYITNLSQFASNLGDNTIYGVYQNPSDINSKVGYYLKNNKTKNAMSGKIEYNNTLGEYQFIGSDGSVTNLGAYNNAGNRSNLDTKFVNYSDTSKENLDRLITAWSRNEALNNSASDAYKMVQSTLSKWIPSGNSPFKEENGEYTWNLGDYYMKVRKAPNGQWQWVFNDKFSEDKTLDEKSRLLEALLRIPVNQRTKEINAKITELRGYKQGGTISAQLGTKFVRVEDPSTITEIPEASPEQKEKANLVKTSLTRQLNINLGTLFGNEPHGENKKTVDAGGVLKDDDKLKLKAALVDLAGTGMGFIPGMNIASAITGAGASATNFYADLQDGFHWGDVGNLAMNLGMDALSLIPVGKSFKALRALGTISKSAPLIMTALNAMGLADPELRASYASTLNKIKNINKIESIKSLNTGDIQNLNAMLGMVLGGKNLAKSRKGFWNTNTTDSGKRRVTAMIDGKQQSLEVDEAFFQNTKGKNQVQELKNKFAEQYNKQNKLEGDKAIKAENVALDTKYFGRRPQSEKVAGTKGDGNWATNNMVGRYFLGYEDPSVPRGLDAYILNYKKKLKVSTDTPTNVSSATASTSTSTKETGLVPTGKRNEFEQFNNEIQGYEKAWRQKEAERINLNRLKIDDSRDWRAGTIPREGSTSKFEGVDAKQLRAVHKISNFIGEVANEMKKPAINRNNLPVPYKGLTVLLPNIQTLIATSPKVKYTGILEGIERVIKQRIARDIYNTKTLRSVQQNTETVARKLAEEVKKNVDKVITMATIPLLKKPLQGASYKAKQTMYNKLFNQRYYDMLDAIRNKELPHKKSNKKKKTSKDNKVKRREWGGLLFKDGGLIPKFQSPSGPIRMQAKSKEYFDRNKGLANYNWGEDLTNYLKTGTIDDYIIGFNGREDNYDALTKASGGTYGDRKYVSNPLATTVQSGLNTYNSGWDRYIRDNIQGYGVTEGQGTGTDTYLGDRTWERSLGHITADLASDFNTKYLNLYGIELFDKGEGNYRLRRLLEPTSSIPEVTVTADKPTASRTANTGAVLENGLIGASGAAGNTGNTSKFRAMPEDILGLTKLGLGISANNRMADLYKDITPNIKTPAQKLAIFTGDLTGTMAANELIRRISDKASLGRTADALLHLAGMLEAESMKAPIALQGAFKDIEAQNRSKSLVNLILNENAIARVDTANENRGSMLATDYAKKLIEASRIGANYEKMVAPWLSGIQNKYKLNNAALKLWQLESAMNNHNAAYLTELASLQDKYKDDYSEFTKLQLLLNNKYKNIMLDEKKALLSNPWLINWSKSGSKLGYRERAALQRAKDFNKRLLEDNKTFHKNMRESKSEYNKILKHMSSFTAALIKRGMQL